MNVKLNTEKLKVSFHTDKFNDPNCRAGGEHQWHGDNLLTMDDGSTMSQRKFNLLSNKMKKDYNVVSSECTCNKCGTPFTNAQNPFI